MLLFHRGRYEDRGRRRKRDQSSIRSSASPSASLAIAAAVAGAMTKTSAFFARPTCPVKSSLHGAKGSVCTGAWVIAEKESGCTNRCAASVMTHVDARPGLDEEARDGRGLVGGNAAGDPKQN